MSCSSWVIFIWMLVKRKGSLNYLTMRTNAVLFSNPNQHRGKNNSMKNIKCMKHRCHKDCSVQIYTEALLVNFRLCCFLLTKCCQLWSSANFLNYDRLITLLLYLSLKVEYCFFQFQNIQDMFEMCMYVYKFKNTQ